MEELFNIGISENTINNMLEINPSIKDMTNNEIITKIALLKKLNCSDNEIINIISSNPLYLNKTNEEIIILTKYLIKLGLATLNILFDSNPYILDLEPFEITNYLNKRIDNGENINDIIDDLDTNPYLFNEM